MNKKTTDTKPDLSELWPLLPPWIEWVAMDDAGYWNGYVSEPILDLLEGMWSDDKDGFIYGVSIPKKYAPTWRGDWRKSLTRRPKG